MPALHVRTIDTQVGIPYEAVGGVAVMDLSDLTIRPMFLVFYM